MIHLAPIHLFGPFEKSLEDLLFCEGQIEDQKEFGSRFFINKSEESHFRFPNENLSLTMDDTREDESASTATTTTSTSGVDPQPHETTTPREEKNQEEQKMTNNEENKEENMTATIKENNKQEQEILKKKQDEKPEKEGEEGENMKEGKETTEEEKKAEEEAKEEEKTSKEGQKTKDVEETKKEDKEANEMEKDEKKEGKEIENDENKEGNATETEEKKEGNHEEKDKQEEKKKNADPHEAQEQSAKTTSPSMHQNPKNDKNGSLRKVWLPEDTYSLLVVGRHPLTIGIALSVMTVQLFIVTILLADLIQIDDKNTEQDDYTRHNPLNIPAAVTGPVKMSQFIALLVTLVSADNMTWALLVYWQNGDIQNPARVGYHQWLTLRHRCHGEDKEEQEDERQPLQPDMDEESALSVSSQPVEVAKETSPSMSKWFPFIWYGSNGLRCFEGCYSFVATFLLIVTSETVVDVLLTFSAIHFVSFLDNVVFWLARVGYFGRAFQTEALHPMCCNIKFTSVPALMRSKIQRQGGEEDPSQTNDSDDTQSTLDNKKNKTQTDTTATTLPIFLRGIVLRIALAVIAVIAWSVVISKQNHGDYLVTHIYVQMGDATNLTLATFSGVYVRSRHRNPDTKRFSYHSRNVQGEDRGELATPKTTIVPVDGGSKARKRHRLMFCLRPRRNGSWMNPSILRHPLI